MVLKRSQNSQQVPMSPPGDPSNLLTGSSVVLIFGAGMESIQSWRICADNLDYWDRGGFPAFGLKLIFMALAVKRFQYWQHYNWTCGRAKQVKVC